MYDDERHTAGRARYTEKRTSIQVYFVFGCYNFFFLVNTEEGEEGGGANFMSRNGEEFARLEMFTSASLHPCSFVIVPNSSKWFRFSFARVRL